MRILRILGLLWTLSGCVGLAVNVAPPNIDEFSQLELPFRVAGANDAVLREIQDYLASHRLPSIVTIRAPKTFVVTTYIQEPLKAEDRRIRRTAFRLALSSVSPTGSPLCTSVAVVALTKSRGIREEVWSVQDLDTTFESSAWPELKAALQKRPCK